WRAISVAAAVISASTRPFAPLPRGPDMNALSTHDKLVISNVSRRGLLKGIAATGGLVLAAQLPSVRGARAAYPTGAASMPNGVVSNPKIFVSIGSEGIVCTVAGRAERGKGGARPGPPM